MKPSDLQRMMQPTADEDFDSFMGRMLTHTAMIQAWPMDSDRFATAAYWWDESAAGQAEAGVL